MGVWMCGCVCLCWVTCGWVRFTVCSHACALVTVTIYIYMHANQCLGECCWCCFDNPQRRKVCGAITRDVFKLIGVWMHVCVSPMHST